MVDATTPPPPPASKSTLLIPPETQQKFPELIELVIGSESMNDEERQYWINILPVMTPDQLSSLKDILHTEKQQLAAIDQKYAKEIQAIGTQQMIKKREEEHRKRRAQRFQQEASQKASETAEAERLLQDIG
jgi:hypothetical protein